MTPAKTNRRLSLGALGQIPDGQNERSEGRWRPGVEGEVECPWHGMLHLTSCLSSWVRGFLMDLLRLCQGGGEEILGWGALCAPALPTSQQSPFLQRHALERGQGILIPGSPLSRSTAQSRVKVGKRSLPEFSRGRRLFGTEGLALLWCQGSDSSCLCARKIILFM